MFKYFLLDCLVLIKLIDFFKYKYFLKFCIIFKNIIIYYNNRKLCKINLN